MTKPLILSSITSSLLFGALSLENPTFSSFGGEVKSSKFVLQNSMSSFVVGFESQNRETNETNNNNFVHRNLGLYSKMDYYNLTPDVTTSSSVSTSEDISTVISVAVDDAEDDTIQTSIVNSGSKGTLSGSGTSFVYQPYTNSYGTDFVKISFDDQFGGIVEKDIQIIINPVDDAPVLSSIGSKSASEDSSTMSIPITISDIDSSVASATYSVSNSNSAIVSASMNGSTLNLTPLPNQFGMATISVTGTVDGKSSSRSFTYNLNSVDDEPSLEAINSQSADEDSSPISVVLSLSDIDSNIANASYSIENSNTDIATATISGNTLQVSPIENKFGSSTITVRATLDGKTVSQSFNYTLNPVDDIQTLEPIANVTSSGEASTVALSISDIDSDIANTEYKITNSNSAIATAVVENGQLKITPTGESSGDVDFTVSATLGDHTVSQTFKYSVNLPVESDLEISSIDDIDLEMSSATQNQSVSFTITSTLGIDSVVASSTSESVSVSTTENSASIVVAQNFVGSSQITITAIDENGEKKSESFNITVSPNESSICLAESSNELTFETIRAGNERQDYVRSDLNLVTSLSSCGEEIPVSWKTSNGNIVSSSGEVQIDEENDFTVQLVATIGENSDEVRTKSFLVTVPKDELTDEIAVEQGLDLITFEMIRGENLKRSEIYSSLDLPIESVSNTVVAWESDSVAIDSSGAVSPENEDTAVSLTATVSKGEVSGTKTFNLTVKGEVSENIEIVKLDKEWLSIANILSENRDGSSITSNLNLPDIGANGSDISWSSSDSSAISEGGSVSRDTTIDKYVSLQATISSGDVSDEKSFFLQVLKLVEVDENTNLEFNSVQEIEDNETQTISMVLNDETNTTVVSVVQVSKELEEKSETIISDESVKTTIESDDSTATVYLNSDGTAQTKVEIIDESGNSVETKVSLKVAGTETEVQNDGSIITKSDNKSVTISSDGTVQHTVEGVIAKSTLAGSSIEVNENGVQTSYEAVSGGMVLTAKVNTDNDANSKTSFTFTDLTTGETTELDSTLSDDTAFDESSSFEIDKNEDGELVIKIQTTISKTLEIK
jgi:hypothetical protein